MQEDTGVKRKRRQAVFLIYALVDPVSLEIRYIGKSSSGLTRPKGHLRESTLKDHLHTHKNRWIQGLTAAARTYEIEVLEYPSEQELDEAEKKWIRVGRAEGWPLTNVTDGGDGQSRGYAPSLEARKNMRAAQLGRRHSAEALANMSRVQRGHVVTADTRKKLADWNRGRKASPEMLQKMRGRIASDATRAKMSASAKSVVHSDEAHEKTAAWHRGKKRGVETRAKMSAAWKNRAPFSAETRAKMSAAHTILHGQARVRRMLDAFFTTPLTSGPQVFCLLWDSYVPRILSKIIVDTDENSTSEF